jgi:AcrR family transcriptional regulator
VYAGTTTHRVCQRAGLSRGAIVHHFHTRAEMVVAALQELALRREGDMVAEAERLPRTPERPGRALDLLWSWFNGPLFHAAVDVAAAARTDPELQASLATIEREFDRRTLLCCREMFAEGEGDRSRDPQIGLALAIVRGLALLPVLQPGSRDGAGKQWAYARAELVELLSRPTSP